MNELTPRQVEILAAVTQSYIDSGRPVGSRYLSESAGFDLAPSTLRNELASLEQMGYLDHPHTSAGRVPTDKGYRFYVDSLAAKRKRFGRELAALDNLEGEIEEALRCATTVLARATGLLAMISMPVQGGAAIRHIEVLSLNPDLVMVVVITSAGGVAKRLFFFEEEVDSGLVNWAGSYLNDAVSGLSLGSRLLNIRLEESDLSPTERDFIDVIRPAFAQAPGVSGEVLFFEGASRLFSRLEMDRDSSVRKVIELLDRQEEMLDLFRDALEEYKVYLLIGSELPASQIQNCSLVAANYGVANRNLGTVGVLGPMRMDYPAVIGSVEHTARSLSHFIEEIF